MENRMFFRLALCAAMAAATFALGVPQPSWAQNPAQAPAASPAKPETKPETKPDAAPAAPAPAATAQPTDPFGEDATLTARPIVYLKGTGTWDNAFETITNSFKPIKTYIN